jgi:hypothetical protein
MRVVTRVSSALMTGLEVDQEASPSQDLHLTTKAIYWHSIVDRLADETGQGRSYAR